MNNALAKTKSRRPSIFGLAEPHVELLSRFSIFERASLCHFLILGAVAFAIPDCHPRMPAFPRNAFPTSTSTNTLGSRYRRFLKAYPFFAFGLPFIGTMLAGSFFLTPATAVRYEKYDRKTHMLDRDEALGLGRVREGAKGRGGRKSRDIREEYWRLAGQGDKLDDWEPKRVKRLPGEPDGTFD